MKPISQKDARRLRKAVAELEDRLADASKVAHAAEERERVANNRAETLATRNAEARRDLEALRAQWKAVNLRLIEPREIIAWDDAPADVASAIEYAGRGGCVLVLRTKVEQDWSGPSPVPQERRTVEVISYRESAP